MGALGLHGDSELLKKFHYVIDIKNDSHGDQLEILQTSPLIHRNVGWLVVALRPSNSCGHV